MKLRKCQKKDLSNLIELFRTTVWTVNAQHYSQEQLEAWAPDSINSNSAEWQSLFTTNSLVAEQKNKIVGFANMTDQGYIDFFYIHHLYIRQGIGRVLYLALEKIAQEKGVTTLTTSSSLTARSFFEAQGFTIVEKEVNQRQHIILESYFMKKILR